MYEVESTNSLFGGGGNYNFTLLKDNQKVKKTNFLSYEVMHEVKSTNPMFCFIQSWRKNITIFPLLKDNQKVKKIKLPFI